MSDLQVMIRSEQPGDESQIHDITKLAFESSDFGYNGEAGLVDKLRSKGAATISLVAECADRIIGHILFSPARLEGSGQQTEGLGLAPMSVLPDLQRRGIGKLLIEAGLESAAQGSSEFVIVLGHPEYYPKFGFTPASESNVRCEFEGVPDEAFLIRWFKHPESNDEQAIAKYHPVFATPG